MRTQTRWRVLVVVALAVVAAGQRWGSLGTTARADTGLAITADQPLIPAFNRSVHDYAVRCSGAPDVVSVNAPDGVEVSVDHAALRSGSFSRSVPLDTGQEFSFSVRQSGATERYYARCLPSDFPTYTYSQDRPVSPGMFVVDGIGTYLAVFDTDGVPLWWMKRSMRPFDSQILTDGTVGFFDPGTLTDDIYTLAGQPVRTLHTVNGATDTHELQLLSNGDYLIDAYIQRPHVDLTAHGGPSDATVLDGEVEEVTPANQLVWSWNSGTYLTPDDTASMWYAGIIANGSPYDLAHLNSAEVHGNEVVISMRHTDAIWGVDRTTGQILWKLGGTPRPESLTVDAHDPQAAHPVGGQHDARILPDGTLTAHDNNTDLAAPPRTVHYRIDEVAKTATLLDSVSDPDLAFSGCCGSARRLADGSWLVGWGDTGIVGGYDPLGERTFKLDFGSIVIYRAIPVPATTSISDVRAGMNVQSPRVDDNLPPVGVPVVTARPRRSRFWRIARPGQRRSPALLSLCDAHVGTSAFLASSAEPTAGPGSRSSSGSSAPPKTSRAVAIYLALRQSE